MDIGLFPLLTVMDNLLWTLTHKLLYRYMLSILLGVELGVEVLGNQTARLTSKVAES